MTTSELLSVYDPDDSKPVTIMKLTTELSRAGFEKVYVGELIKTRFSGPQKFWAVRNRKELLRIVKPAKLAEIYDAERGLLRLRMRGWRQGGAAGSRKNCLP
jgi:hypothetical protein